MAVADYVLSATPGDTVSNLSSTRALRDVTERHGGHYAASAVGEVNVVAKMKETGAVIGGEGQRRRHSIRRSITGAMPLWAWRSC